MIYTWKYISDLGPITLAGSERELTGLWFEGQKHFARGLGLRPEISLTPVFRQTIEWLDCYFAGGIPDFVPALAPEGTPFQKAVWETLRTIPYGQAMTYGQLAARVSARSGALTVIHAEERGPIHASQGAKLKSCAGGNAQLTTGPAAKTDSHSAARAVGQAVGRNPISLIIPCHRIIASGASLGGYAAGLWRKERLLKFEGILH